MYTTCKVQFKKIRLILLRFVHSLTHSYVFVKNGILAQKYCFFSAFLNTFSDSSNLHSTHSDIQSVFLHLHFETNAFTFWCLFAHFQHSINIYLKKMILFVHLK